MIVEKYLTNLGNERLHNLLNAAWIGLVGTVSLYVAYSGNGYEWRNVYQPAVVSDFVTYGAVANPPYVLFIFEPLALLPTSLAVLLLTALSFGCIQLTSLLTKTNRWLILSFSQTIVVLLVAQIDLWVMLGAALGFYALKRNQGLLLGVAGALLLLKPQLGGVLLLVYFLESRRKTEVIITMVGIVLASFMLHGFWLIDWLSKILVWGQGNIRHNISLFPYGLILFLLPLLLRRFYTKFQWYSALLACSLLAAPYSAEYSVVAALAFPQPIWLFPLSWLIFLPISIRPYLVPLTLILYPLATGKVTKPTVQS